MNEGLLDGKMADSRHPNRTSELKFCGKRRAIVNYDLKRLVSEDLQVAEGLGCEIRLEFDDPPCSVPASWDKEFNLDLGPVPARLGKVSYWRRLCPAWNPFEIAVLQ